MVIMCSGAGAGFGVGSVCPFLGNIVGGMIGTVGGGLYCFHLRNVADECKLDALKHFNHVSMARCIRKRTACLRQCLSGIEVISPLSSLE